jgi:hypothetical protein
VTERSVMSPLVLIAVSLILLVPAATGAREPGQEQRGAAPRPSGPPAPIGNPRDFSGIWIGGGIDVTGLLLPGEEVSLTQYGAERYKSNNYSKSPANTCMPYGVTRAMHSTDPQQWVQTPGMLVLLYEQMSHYRMIYTDGRPHASDAQDFPSWMGHSVGRWEGDTLVVDTIGIDERSWLDSGGLEHSDKMHLVERLRKMDGNTIQVTMTIEDPVFFTKPFTYVIIKRRVNSTAVPRILPAICNENELDAKHIQPDPPSHVKPPRFPN